MIIYCKDCGKKIEHKALEKPNFCPKCGFSFLKGGATPSPQKSITDEVVDDFHDVKENEANIDLTQLEELDFDIEYQPTAKGETIGSIIDKTGNTQPTKRTKSKHKKISKKQRKNNAKKNLEDFKKEAGTSRST